MKPNRKLIAALAVSVLLAGLALASSSWRGVYQRVSGAATGTARSAPFAATPASSPPALGPGGLGIWEFMGPANSGGPLSDVRYLPGNGQVAFAVTQGGDVYRSTDGGASWTLLSHVPLLGARLEPVAGRPGAIFAYGQWRIGNNGQIALFYSVDGGQTWEERRPAIGPPYGLNTIVDLRTVPGRPDEVWAVVSSGLIRSTDAGLTWALVYSQGFTTDCSGVEISVPAQRVYTMCRGTAWNVIAAQLDGSGWAQLTHRTTPSAYARVAISPSQTGVIYLATFGEGHDISNGPYYLGQVLRSSDGGISWDTRFTRQSADRVGTAVPGDFDVECSSPDYGALTSEHAQVVVDPANSDSLWIAGYEVFRSDDGATTFGRVQARADMVVDEALGLYSGMTRRESATSITFAPGYAGGSTESVLLADARGVLASTNARAAAQTAPGLSCGSQAQPAVSWARRNQGLSGARVVGGDVGGSGEIVASSPDFGIAVSDGSAPNAWASLTQAHDYAVGDISLDPVRGASRFVASSALGIYNWEWNSAAHKWLASRTTFYANGATPWGYQPGYLNDAFMPWSYYRFARDPGHPDRLVTGDGSGVYETQDLGALWQLISPNIWVNALGIRRDGSVVAATTTGFLLSQVYPNTQQWVLHDVDGCERASGSCTRDAVSFSAFVTAPNPADNTLFGTARTYDGSPRIWRSSNGRVWTPVDPATGQPGALPSGPSDTSLAIDPDNPSHMYAGTSGGLYVSEDGGASWTEAAVPFAAVPVARLVFSKTNGHRRLYAFTYGRGIWSADVAPSTTFVDVPTYHWAYDYIGRLFRAGVTAGCSAQPLMYCPDSAVTRDQMAVFLLRAKNGGTYAPPAASGTFADVPPNFWAAAWIEQLRADGITNGCSVSPALYCPTQTVTRDQMAVFILRALHGGSYVPPAASGVFEDVPADQWAAPWIEQLAREGITGGCSSTPKLYCPTAPVTRDQMAVFMDRAFGF